METRHRGNKQKKIQFSLSNRLPHPTPTPPLLKLDVNAHTFTKSDIRCQPIIFGHYIRVIRPAAKQVGHTVDRPGAVEHKHKPIHHTDHKRVERELVPAVYRNAGGNKGRE